MSGSIPMKVKWDTKKLAKKINRKITKEMRQAELGETVKDLLVASIRTDAISPKTGRKFRALTKKTITNRKYLAKYNSTHSEYSASKPNLTFTGELLDSLKASFHTSGDGVSFEIKPTGSHTPYNRGGSKSTPNHEIIRHLKKMGRSPLHWSKKMQKQIKALIRKEVNQALKKF